MTSEFLVEWSFEAGNFHVGHPEDPLVWDDGEIIGRASDRQAAAVLVQRFVEHRKLIHDRQNEGRFEEQKTLEWSEVQQCFHVEPSWLRGDKIGPQYEVIGYGTQAEVEAIMVNYIKRRNIEIWKGDWYLGYCKQHNLEP